MIRIMMAGAVLFGFVSCAKPWAGITDTVMLNSASILPGKHCESSAMLNMLRYLGYPVSESMIAGGGGAPSFVYQKGAFPFLGGRNNSMREVFFSGAGIVWKSARDENPEQSWSGVLSVLNKGMPVVLRVDMRYLPYRYGGKYGPSYTSFGWHMITLFGIDGKKQIALVSDTEYSRLQEIKLSDLDKARSSGTKMFPPLREYYWAEKMPASFRIDWKKLADGAFREVSKNMEENTAAFGPNAVTGLAGLKNLGGNILNIEDDVKTPFLLPAVLGTLHGYIARFGTDGAAFRLFFRDFVKEAAVRLNDARLAKLVPFIDDSARSWQALADEFLRLSSEIKKANNREKRREMLGKASFLADTLYRKEVILDRELKKYLQNQ